MLFIFTSIFCSLHFNILFCNFIHTFFCLISVPLLFLLFLNTWKRKVLSRLLSFSILFVYVRLTEFAYSLYFLNNFSLFPFITFTLYQIQSYLQISLISLSQSGIGLDTSKLDSVLKTLAYPYWHPRFCDTICNLFYRSYSIISILLLCYNFFVSHLSQFLIIFLCYRSLGLIDVLVN